MPNLNINGKRWKIQTANQTEIMEVFRLAHGRSIGPLDGICDYERCRILIRDDLRADEKKTALTHELIHAFCPGLTEKQVCRLERLIAMVGELV